jgi:hypothetical protein
MSVVTLGAAMADRLAAALEALRIVAEADPDHARDANGRGFAKGDVTVGHRLAAASISRVRQTTPAAQQAIALAARYRRQVPTRLVFEMGLTDQPDFFD